MLLLNVAAQNQSVCTGTAASRSSMPVPKWPNTILSPPKANIPLMPMFGVVFNSKFGCEVKYFQRKQKMACKGSRTSGGSHSASCTVKGTFLSKQFDLNRHFHRVIAVNTGNQQQIGY